MKAGNRSRASGRLFVMAGRLQGAVRVGLVILRGFPVDALAADPSPITKILPAQGTKSNPMRNHNRNGGRMPSCIQSREKVGFGKRNRVRRWVRSE